MGQTQEKSIRVLRSRVKLLGKERSRGDIIQMDDFAKISGPVQSALISSGTVEMLGGSTTQDDLLEILGQQAQKIADLEKRVKIIEDAARGGDNVLHIIETGSVQEEQISEATRKARKGDRVQIEHNSDDEIYLIEGEVQQVRSGVASIITDDGNEYDIDVTSLIVI